MNHKQFKKQFLSSQKQFHLGHLTTEKSHYLTKGLSQLCKNDLAKALTTLQAVDRQMLNKLSGYAAELKLLQSSIRKVLDKGSSLFICGCGATGRLALTLETLFIKEYPNKKKQIKSFMAGGDFALIKSVEDFEDKDHFGAKQLIDLGFKDGDLLISATEGGETSFVIGATLAAAKISSQKPFFLFCNPYRDLMKIERSVRVLNHSKIQSISVAIGPMALSGSTRMQATSSLLILIGIALLYYELSEDDIVLKFNRYINELNKIRYNKLYPFVNREYDSYQNNRLVNYLCDQAYAISILTDTTERSPTFSLNPFESNSDKHLSYSFLIVENTQKSSDAWLAMLGRTPRGLNWNEIQKDLSLKAIYDFDISKNSLRRREKYGADTFCIMKKFDSILFSFKNANVYFPIAIKESLFEHLMLKLLLNTHSTSLMGKMGRYHSNVMTWVKASNFKLVDRSIRYVDLLLKEQGHFENYQDILSRLLKLKDATNQDEPIVLKVVNSFINKPY